MERTLINSETFKFNRDNDECQLVLETKIYVGEYGPDIVQEFHFYPRVDSRSTTILNLGMNFMSPRELRELANQLERQINMAKDNLKYKLIEEKKGLERIEKGMA